MTIQTIRAGYHVSPKAVLVAIAGGVLAAAAGFGVAAVSLDEPATPPSSTIVVQDGAPAQPGSDAYDGTDREVRGLMHRR